MVSEDGNFSERMLFDIPSHPPSILALILPKHIFLHVEWIQRKLSNLIYFKPVTRWIHAPYLRNIWECHDMFALVSITVVHYLSFHQWQLLILLIQSENAVAYLLLTKHLQTQSFI